MTSLLSWLASVMGRRPRIATFAVLFAVIALIGGGMAVGGAFKDDFTVPGIESQAAQDLLEQRFPQQSGTSAVVVFSSDDAKLSADALAPTLKRIEGQPHVTTVDPLRTSEDGRTAFATVSYDQDATDLGADARKQLETATAKLPAGVAVAMSGEPIDGAATGGFPIGELAGLLIAVALLIAVLKSVRAARNALGTALVGVAAGFGVLMWIAALTDVPGLAPTLGGMLGLGAGIDYALLLTARQQEELRKGRDPRDAARRTNRSAGESAMTAAGIVLVSISGLLVTGIPFVGRAGVAAGLVVLVCAVVCVTLLPARFAKAGDKLLPKRERKATETKPSKPVKRSVGDQAPRVRAARRRPGHRRARRSRRRPAARPAGRSQPRHRRHAAPGVRPARRRVRRGRQRSARAGRLQPGEGQPREAAVRARGRP